MANEELKRYLNALSKRKYKKTYASLDGTKARVIRKLGVKLLK